jgi:uncharacterized protein (UPF0264 family)
MAELLVSVRSVHEAAIALESGAALIDIKEPSRGSLGRADDAVVTAVVEYVGERRPVSAALGELLEDPTPCRQAGLTYAKYGLGGYGKRQSWRRDLAAAQTSLRAANPHCHLVLVAYADWRQANAPPPEEICEFAAGIGCAAFLIDTCVKDGGTLLDWLSISEILQFGRRCKSSGMRLALAGSLGSEEIIRLKPAQPDWFAVRGAVCCNRRRGQDIDPEAVLNLIALLATEVTADTSEN